MRILFFGDVVGRSGRDALRAKLPQLITAYKADFTIVNAENAAGGYGLTEAIAAELFACGVGCLTTGNHVWDQRELITFIEKEPRILRPLNYPPRTPGRGANLFYLPEGRTLLVINAIGRLFMDPFIDDPFRALDNELGRYNLGKSAMAAVVDIHAEASSEKQAIGYYLDGRVSAVIGTHTHVPTADARLLPKGTAYQTDAGMCGDYESVLGMKFDTAIQRFVRKLPTERLKPSEAEASICGVMIDSDDKTGLALSIEPLIVGGRLVEPGARRKNTACVGS